MGNYRKLLRDLNSFYFYFFLFSSCFICGLVFLTLVYLLKPYFHLFLVLSVCLFLFINLYDIWCMDSQYIEFKDFVLERGSLWDYFYENNIPYRLKDMFFDLKECDKRVFLCVLFLPLFCILFSLERCFRALWLLALLSSIATSLVTKVDKEYEMFLEVEVVESFRDFVLLMGSMSMNSCFIKVYKMRLKGKKDIRGLVENILFTKSIGRSKFYINMFVHSVRFVLESVEIIKKSPKKKNFVNIKWLSLRNVNFYVQKHYVDHIYPFWTCKIIVKNGRIITNMKKLILGLTHYTKSTWKEKEQSALVKAGIKTGNVDHEGRVISPEVGKYTQSWSYTSKPAFEVNKLLLKTFLDSNVKGRFRRELNIESVSDYNYEVYLNQEYFNNHQYMVPSYVKDDQVELVPMNLQQVLLHKAALEKMKILSAIKRVQGDEWVEEDPKTRQAAILREIHTYPDVIVERGVRIRELNVKINATKSLTEKEGYLKEKFVHGEVINHTLAKWAWVGRLALVQGRISSKSMLIDKDVVMENVSSFVKEYEKSTGEYYEVVKEELKSDGKYTGLDHRQRFNYLNRVKEHYKKIPVKSYLELVQSSKEGEGEMLKNVPEDW